MIRRMQVATERWPWAQPVTIAGHTFTESDMVVVRLSDGRHQGWGEAVGVFYHGDSAAGMARQIESVRDAIEAGANQLRLRELLPPGGARNAVDCALWDLEATAAALPVWQLANLRAPAPVLTTFTIGAAAPDTMATIAVEACQFAKAIKLKLLGDHMDADRVAAVRAARPDVWLGVDGNQGFTPDTLQRLMPTLVRARVSLIEQPCRVGEEWSREEMRSPIPLAADESVQSLRDLPALPGHFDVVNIKLDKCGGLTEALMMVDEVRRLGLRPMVGNMGGTSLAMAPASLLAQYCEFVDLDGPLFLAADRNPPMAFDDGVIRVPRGLWGGIE
jgi:L-alanine-DL-glutamate epimerase-like enolase superfamily enzyme